MTRRSSAVLLALLVIIGFIVGGKVGKQSDRDTSVSDTDDRSSDGSRRMEDLRRGSSRATKHHMPLPKGREELPQGAIPGQRWVTFQSDEAMRRFIASIDGTGIAVLDSIDSLKTLRLAVLNQDALDALLDGSERRGFIFPAYIPGQGSVQPDAVGFGQHFLSYLGIDGDRSGWGAGIKVAVLDSGVGAHSLFSSPVQSVNLVELPADRSNVNSHGTAVASLIAGQNGLAPDATILDYRIARDDGTSDTFMIAQAVLAAIDAGADVINLSLGSYQRSALLEDALRDAREAGIAVIASAGNNGIDWVLHPASSQHAIGVGAIDGRGEHLDFSNTGELAITAPGLALTTVGFNSEPMSFSGTSASAPMLSGAVAVVMSQMNVTADRAWELILENANDAGAPGSDEVFGAGILDLGRVLQSGNSGIFDLAVTANHLAIDSAGFPILQVVIQNQGTSTASNAPVTVRMPDGTYQFNVGSLPPGEVNTFELPLGAYAEGARIDSAVTFSSGTTDQDQTNNRRIDFIIPKDTP